MLGWFAVFAFIFIPIFYCVIFPYFVFILTPRALLLTCFPEGKREALCLHPYFFFCTRMRVHAYLYIFQVIEMFYVYFRV
jgi:hypothetical protein